MNMYRVRKDLQNGKTIEQVCKDHNITFKTLCDTFHGYIRTKKKTKSTTPTKYIEVRNGRACVRKTINGKTRIFGTYNRLEDAIIMRDALEQDGWHQTHVDRLCQELGIERRKGQINEKVRYH